MGKAKALRKAQKRLNARIRAYENPPGPGKLPLKSRKGYHRPGSMKIK